MSPSSHLLSENSWKLRLKTALPLGFTFLCLSVGVTGASCLEQPPGTTQALAADHGFACPEIFPEIPWEDACRTQKKPKNPTPNQQNNNNKKIPKPTQNPRNTQNQTTPKNLLEVSKITVGQRDQAQLELLMQFYRALL